MTRHQYESLDGAGLWVVCPKCGNDKAFRRLATERITETMRKRYLYCRVCNKRITVIEEKPQPATA